MLWSGQFVSPLPPHAGTTGVKNWKTNPQIYDHAICLIERLSRNYPIKCILINEIPQPIKTYDYYSMIWKQWLVILVILERFLSPPLNHVNGQSRIPRKVNKKEQRPALPVADITADHALSLQNYQTALSGQSLGFHYNNNATDCAKDSCCITMCYASTRETCPVWFWDQMNGLCRQILAPHESLWQRHGGSHQGQRLLHLLSPPVQIARWALMRYCLSVCVYSGYIMHHYNGIWGTHH